MRAGALKYRLVLMEPVYAPGRMGDKKADYIDRGTVWAERVKMTGNRSEEVGEHFADYRVEFNIRDAHRVSENWHVRQLGGYEYIVTNVIPNLDRGMKTLVCDRLNK